MLGLIGPYVLQFFLTDLDGFPYFVGPTATPGQREVMLIHHDFPTLSFVGWKVWTIWGFNLGCWAELRNPLNHDL